MSETETEPTEPVVDDDPDQDEGAEDDEQHEQAPTEPIEPEPEAAAPKSEKDVDKATEKLIRERDRHAGRISEIMGDDATLLEVCPRCWEYAPGFIWGLDQGPVDDEQRAAVLASLGMGANPEPTLPMAKGVEECPTCEGYGELALPSKSPHHQTMTCSTCAGMGYVTNEADKPAWTPQPIDPAAFQTAPPQYGNGGQTDDWGRPLGHPHFGQNPAYIGV